MKASPDGQWVLAHVMNQLYVIAMPVVGGEAPTVDVSTPSVPVKRLTDIGADYFGWADDGKTITWAVGASYFREPLSAITFEPPKEEEKKRRRQEGSAERKRRMQDKDEKKDEKKEAKKLKEQDKNVTGDRRRSRSSAQNAEGHHRPARRDRGDHERRRSSEECGHRG